ncbi:MAG: hypothetical protein HOA17_07225 [Candidatus Melainabacteria bacterium]|jgi:hypothetical protein|nr:hypothetical protein [Candidatus Melainabacteria bacterium]
MNFAIHSFQDFVELIAHPGFPMFFNICVVCTLIIGLPIWIYLLDGQAKEQVK